MHTRAGQCHTGLFTIRSLGDTWIKLILVDQKAKTKTLPQPRPRLCAPMDICVQLTCGQGQHAGGVKREENQADIQDGSHFPPSVAFYSSRCLRPRVVVMSPSLRSWRGITHSGEEEKQHGFKLNAPDFIHKATLRSEGGRKSAPRWKKVALRGAIRLLVLRKRPKEREYRVLFALFSLLNASCSLIIHKFILSKPLLSVSSHTVAQSFPPLSVLSLLLFFSLSPSSDG